jgi:glycosyltransferase involved in cell wall biosynthesis
LNILIIPSWYPTNKHHLVGMFFREQAALLQQLHEVRVMFGVRHILSRLRWIKKNGFKVYTVHDNQPSTGVIENRFEYITFLKNEKFLINSMIRSYKQILYHMLDEGWKPDIIHAMSSDPAGFVAASLSKEFHIPWIITEHQVFGLSNLSEYRRNLVIDAIKLANVVVAVSQHQLRCIALHGVDREMVVVGNLIDEDVFRFVEPINNRGKFHILAVTYPSSLKGNETLFQSVALMVSRGHTDIELNIIGKQLYSDADISHFHRMAVKYGVSEICRFIPEASREDMPKYYANSDVFVSTSIAETFGVAVREAMAVGRPVVCTASGGVDDDIHDFNGIKVNIGNYSAITDALIAIKTGTWRFNPLDIRNYVVVRYGRQAFLNQMCLIYERAVQNNHTEISVDSHMSEK